MQAVVPAVAAPAPAIWFIPSCADVCVRVQAIWEAFCKCAADWIDYVLGFLVAPAELKAPQPPIPQPVPQQLPALAPPQQQNIDDLLDQFEKVYEDHLEYTATCTFQRRRIPDMGHLARVRYLMDAYKLLHAVANPFLTPALSAPFGPLLNHAQIFLQLGADPNLPSDQTQDRPLHCAVYTGSIVAYRTLREGGADPLLKNREGQTPLDLAAKILTSGRWLHHYFIMNVLGSKNEHLIDHFPLAYAERFVGNNTFTRHVQKLAQTFPQVYLQGDPMQTLMPRMQVVCGHSNDVQAMLDYEKERVNAILERLRSTPAGQLSRPLQEMIGWYLMYQVIEKPDANP